MVLSCLFSHHRPVTLEKSALCEIFPYANIWPPQNIDQDVHAPLVPLLTQPSCAWTLFKGFQTYFPFFDFISPLPKSALHVSTIHNFYISLLFQTIPGVRKLGHFRDSEPLTNGVGERILAGIVPLLYNC